jgi:hypothetical protein
VEKCIVTINSVLAQDFKHYDLIILDNGSAGDCCKQLVAQFPFLVVCPIGNNLGYSAGNNIALRYACENGYDYVIILNDDLLLPENYISEMLITARLHPDAGIVGSYVKHYQTDTYQSCGGKFSWLRGIDDHLKKEIPGSIRDVRVETVHGCALLFSCHAVHQGLLFDETLYMYVDELDLGLRAKLLGINIYITCSVTVKHDNNAGSGISPSPLQVYYITRNRVVVTLRNVTCTQKLLFLNSLLFESVYKLIVYSLVKLRPDLFLFYLQGIIHGFSGHLGKKK